MERALQPEPSSLGGVIGPLAMALCLGLTASAAAWTLAGRNLETTLSNGLKVLLVEEPKAPVV